MRAGSFILLLLAFGPAVPLGAVEREIVRSFAVAPGCELKVDTYRGEIEIEESDRAEITVSVSIEAVADQAATATRLLEAVRVECAQEGNRVTISARNPLESGPRFTWGDQGQVDLKFRISVPRQCDVDLRVIDGRVVIGNLAGRMQARIDRGSLFLRRIEGAVTAHVGLGDFILSRCSGAVTARVRSGLIRAGTLGGRAELSNDTGDVEVLVVRHSLVAKAQRGDVRVGFGPGLAAASRVTVAAGNLFADFHAQSACRVAASATWGRVHSTLPLAVESGASGQRALSGRLNGGGPLIELRASGGNVKLEPGLQWVEDGK